MNVIKLIILFFAIINVVAFALMGIDKYKAKKHLWRIPEATLFLFVIIGGSVGGLLGMYAFHHKTRHWYFRFGFPLILIIQLVILYLIWRSPIEFTILSA